MRVIDNIITMNIIIFTQSINIKFFCNKLLNKTTGYYYRHIYNIGYKWKPRKNENPYRLGHPGGKHHLVMEGQRKKHIAKSRCCNLCT